MDLVSRDKVTEALRLDRLGLEFLSPGIYNLMGLEKANQTYASVQGMPGPELVDALFDQLNVEFEFDPKELSHFPETGPFWLISNHPNGIWDGLVLMKIMAMVRPEFKVITLFMLERLKELRPHIVPVNSWQDKSDLKGNHASMKEILKTLQYEQNPIGLFPAGSVSRYITKYGKVTDPPWNPTAIKLIDKVKIPIIPMKIYGGNSKLFYLASFWSDTLRRGMNFPEFFKKSNKTIKVKIGPQVSNELYDECLDLQEKGEFLRKQVYQIS